MSPRAARAALTALVLLVAGLLGVAATTTPAAAAYPGQDGRIAFVRANQIYSMNQWGGDVKKLTTSGRNYQPTWSPDGRRISFIHEAGGRRDVWVMSAGGARKRAVTTSGDVASAGATWSPDGRTLAYDTTQLTTIRSTSPFGPPRPVDGLQTGGFCEADTPSPVRVDRFLAWSPDGTRIAVLSNDDCQLDFRMDHYYVATGEQRFYDGSGADCCGYLDWTDLFWGPGNQFGYSQRDRGQNGEITDAPSFIVYPGFRSLAGDTGGAPSPSGTFMALTNASSGTAMIVRARSDGTGRRTLTVGYQPDWQVRPR
jgi:dipeptidyl aminopeptidase/acylaminoacyl peptidase